jgi:hypothetical protein
MGYAITFYALNGRDFARRLRESTTLLQEVEARIHEAAQGEYDEQGLHLALTTANIICRNEIPADCGLEYFYSLCWLAEVAAERVAIYPYQGFRHLSYLEEIGVWTWFQQARPPFAVPICNEPPPEVGFLAADDIEHRALPAFDALPPNECRDVNNARDELKDVLETLVSDRLDLLAVLI